MGRVLCPHACNVIFWIHVEQADNEDRKKIRAKEVKEKQEKMRALREERADAQNKLAEIEKKEAEGQ